MTGLRSQELAMTVGIPKETSPGERRVAATPASVQSLTKLGFRVLVEPDAGLNAGFDDRAYLDAGAAIGDAASVWASPVVAKIRPPAPEEVSRLSAGQTLISYLYPAQNAELVDGLKARGLTAIGMDQVPRTTRAQKVDALSSMGNLSGYRAVIEAANALQRPLGGQTTAAGKIPPCKVLIIGAGVAGLAAIGAARALGAIVRAFDTRPAVKEQVASMGAEFLELDVAEDGSGEGGYAREMSPAFIAAEMALFAAQAADVDVIVTTALIPGKRAPILITSQMVASMKRGSVIVDLAAEMGGNCERTVPGAAVDVDGVTVIGYTDLPSRLALQASTLYATNIVNLLEEMGGAAGFTVDESNDIVRPMTVLKDGVLMWPPPKMAAAPAAAAPTPAATPADRPAIAPARSAPPAAAAPHATRSAKGAHHGPPAGGASSTGTWVSLAFAGVALLLLGLVAPPTFVTHLTVFVLACFVGYHVVWSVTPALHTPLMSVTNAISGIIVLGGMLQIVRGAWSAAELLGIAAVFLAMINVSGGFLVTQRMLKMFRR
jgi:NAD(P) transhydrogenase subunit alpha